MLNTREALNRFGKGVVKQSRSSLTRQGKNVDKKLWNSLSFNLEVGKNSFRVEFEMEDYGKFQDEGVKGANPSLVKGGEQKAPSSRFSFTNKRPPTKPIQEWVNKKGIRFRDAQGRFKKGGSKTLAYLISRSIYAQGIKPSRFFTRSFETQFNKLPEQLVEAFALDLDDFIKFTRE